MHALQVNKLCMAPPQAAQERQVIFESKIEGIVFASRNNYLPVFRIAALARDNPPLDPELYEDGQIAGYTVYTYAVFQNVCFQHPPGNEKNDQRAQQEQIPYALNIRALLKPFQIDTRANPVTWIDGSVNYTTPEGQSVSSTAAFESGEWWDQEFSVSVDTITLVDGQDASKRYIFTLKDAWVAFGDAKSVPASGSKATSQSFPGSLHEALRGSVLPPTRLALVRDLLVRTKSISRATNVGKYVLFSGEAV